MVIRKKFFIIGPGRSGTSMFQDEINSHPEIRCFLEPFHSLAANPRKNPLFAGEPLYDEFTAGNDQLSEPAAFLKFLDFLAQEAGSPIWGFKIIGSQIQERPGLLAVLREAGFDALLINRRNEVQTALSLLIALQRGVYNSRQLAPVGKITIDCTELLRTILTARKAKDALALLVVQSGFRVQELIYEDRLTQGVLYNRLALDFLGADPLSAGEKSTFIRMAPAGAYPDIIANYEQVLAALKLAKLDHLFVGA